MLNFQVIIFFADDKQYSQRTTYTILKDEIKNNDLNSFADINSWFNSYFHNSPLDQFIDTSSFSEKVSKVELKIGRITNTLSGEYQTY